MRRTSKSIFAKDPSIENNYQYYFKDLNMIMNSEASYGQRNFARNLDAMLAIVLTNSKQNSKWIQVFIMLRYFYQIYFYILYNL